MPARTKLAQLIAKQEGFGVPGAVPTRSHNPGDLRHSPHSEHLSGKPDGIGIIDTDDHGWDDLERQLWLNSKRMVEVDPKTKQKCPARWMTLEDCIYLWAPPEDNNNTSAYLDGVLKGFKGDLAYGDPVTAGMKLSYVLSIPAVEEAPKVTT